MFPIIDGGGNHALDPGLIHVRLLHTRTSAQSLRGPQPALFNEAPGLYNLNATRP